MLPLKFLSHKFFQAHIVFFTTTLRYKMRKLTYAICLSFIGVFLSANAEQCVVTETEECCAHETSFLASTQDLYFDNNEMMVVVGERAYPVKALQRSGNQWRVQVVSSGYCQMGHNLCRGCHLCHLQGCIYFVRHCNLWD